MAERTLTSNESKRYYKIAFALAIIHHFLQYRRRVISTYLGYEDESLALFGFGADSFIEVISGLGIAHMIIRIQKQPNSNRSQFEQTALRITGVAFYILVVALVITSFYNIWTGHQPITTLFGMIISIISIFVMLLLVHGKRKVGKQLNSDPILADASCTMVCVYMSIILLISSGIYELTSLPYIDSLGTLGLAYFSFKEGKECFEKANSEKYCGCD